jgi:CO/xanthine dehydrogenase Mo-binding subunit
MTVTLPGSLIENPRLDLWIRFLPDRTVRIATGKVEIGQGIVTALGQIAADELDLPYGRIVVLSGDTAEGPDELYTSSSHSIEVGGSSIRLICAEVRAKALERAALRLNCSPTDLTVAEGRFIRNGTETGQDYWTVAGEIDLTQNVKGMTAPKPASAYSVVGQDVPRLDLPAKVGGGGAFIHDALPPGTLHARVLRQPSRGAQLASLDEAAIRRAAKGEFRILREANFVAFVSETEGVAEAAAAAAERHAKWDRVRRLTPEQQEAAWLKGQPSDDRPYGAPVPATPPKNLVQATYSRPYVAHASLAPSCALAEWRDGNLTLWSHGQGMHPLRRNVGAALGLPVEAVTARHLHGAGCYGHNGADDAAFDAALVAMRMPGRRIRVRWRREEEFGFEPVGPAMLVTLHVDLDDRGYPADWTTEIWSPTHVQRPGSGGALLASEALANPPALPKPSDPPVERGGGATRNAIPLYDVPVHRILHHLTLNPPVRTSALRGLGALPNVFAIESMLDDLAARIGQDPLAYRLAILSNLRARRLLEQVAERCGWASRGPAGSGRGLGLGFAQYKNRSAYAAVAASVTVDEEVRVERVWCVADAGVVVNPDGARNQLEGGIVQAISWTLKEQVRFDEQGIASRDWESYPILRFSEVPEMQVELVDGDGNPPLGIGECTCGPAAAAVGNAVAHALGIRVRDMPFTRERIVKALA